MSPVRVALLTEIPAPFRIPLFNALAEQDGVDLEVLFLSDRDPRRSYRVYREEFRFASHVLPGWSFHRNGLWVVLNRSVVRALRRFGPDVVIVGGWNQPAFLAAAAYARLARRPLATWVESTARDARPGARATEAAKRAMVRASTGFLVPGTAAAEYVRALGAVPERITVAPNAVDARIFRDRVAEARRRRDEIRSALGLEGCVVLSVGRLEDEKGPDVLVRAMGEAPGTLALVGSGSLEPRLRKLAPEGRVRFVGHVERDKLPDWYAAADVFVLPSRSETWGMVLNEAAWAGLPLVASEAAGGAYDLIEEGVNGFRFPSEDPSALAAVLRRLAEDPALRERAGLRSRELAERFTPEAWADAVAGLARRLAAGRAMLA